MIQTIATTPFFGVQLVAYGGMITLFFVLFTALVGFLNYKGKSLIPFHWHPILAGLTILSALIHGLFGLSISLGF